MSTAQAAEVVSFAVVLVAMFAVGIYFQACWSLVGSVMIVERRFGPSALRRSRMLVIGVWWKTWGILLTAFLIATVPASALRFIWTFIPVVGVLLTGATQAVSGAYAAVVVVIYYFDRRCRTEDFDLLAPPHWPEMPLMDSQWRSLYSLFYAA